MGTPSGTNSQAVEARRNAYIDSRWEQLYELEKEWGKEAIKYLMLMNAGGAVATLSFIGTSNPAAHDWKVAVALVAYFLGIVSAGLMVAYAYESMSRLFRGWTSDHESYAKGDLSYDEFTKRDSERVPSGVVDRLLGYASFFCFIGGSVIGALALLCK